MRYRIHYDWVRSDHDWFGDSHVIEAEDNQDAVNKAKKLVAGKNKRWHGRGRFELTAVRRIVAVAVPAMKEKTRTVRVPLS